MKQEEIIQEMEKVFAECRDFFDTFPADKLHAAEDGKWSPLQQLDHLNKSVAPLAAGLGMPKIVLRTSFGKPNGRPARSYEEQKERYLQALAVAAQKGSTAPKEFAAGESLNKTEVLNEWDKQTSKLIKVFAKKWPEDKLDAYLLPHPLIGKLLIREMMFFTIYHTRHHIANAERGM